MYGKLRHQNPRLDATMCHRRGRNRLLALPNGPPHLLGLRNGLNLFPALPNARNQLPDPPSGLNLLPDRQNVLNLRLGLRDRRSGNNRQLALNSVNLQHGPKQLLTEHRPTGPSSTPRRKHEQHRRKSGGPLNSSFALINWRCLSP